jgi:hypothetical protein
MSTSQNVMNSVVFVTTLIKNQRLNVNGQEPAVTMSNIVLQRVLGPPFRWRQNRSSFSFAINTAGGTDQGNITFRFDSIPAANYTAYFDYQKKAQLIQSWADPWGVIPDECGYIYNTGLLALAALLVNDARFQIWNREFVASLLATQDGLDEQAKAIFLAGWLNDMRSAQRSQSASQLGTQGRGQ